MSALFSTKPAFSVMDHRLIRHPVLLPLGILIFMIGCATIPGARPDLLDFLTPGCTSRQEVITTLGQPSACFERERILTYRIGQDRKQRFYLVEPKQAAQWNSARFSLVLLFDEKGVLKEKKTVPVQ